MPHKTLSQKSSPFHKTSHYPKASLSKKPSAFHKASRSPKAPVSRKANALSAKPQTERFFLPMLLLLCAVTTLMQGVQSLAALPASCITGGCLILFALASAALLVFRSRRTLSEEHVVFFLLFCGMLLHCWYVLLSGLYDRQHDEGFYTGIASPQINPGHIGYIEYIYKFHKLPDINPYQYFSYYHPPLHYILSGLWLFFLTSLGMAEDLAFENLQILPLFYSGLLMLLTYRILKRINAAGKGLYAGLLLVAIHPALTIMSGSVNNDMLSTLLLTAAILATLRWLQDKTCLNLLLIAISIGLGILCKINAAVIALPTGLVFLCDFLHELRTGNKPAIRRCLFRYFLFGCTAGTIGLSWIARNLLRFHVKPGISSATESSVMYTGNYGIWSRIGLPSLSDWHFAFPFHALSGEANHNIWVILFQTSLFAEEYPSDLTGLPLLFCQAAYPAAILFATACAALFLAAQCRKAKMAQKEIRKADAAKAGLEALYLSAGYLAFLFSFLLFALNYPFTCSSDFRYIAVCLVYNAIGLADGSRLYAAGTVQNAGARLARAGVCATLALMVIVYLTWRRW